MSENGSHFEERESIVIRFAGDSGDGMQLTGAQFTNTSAMAGNDISTMPDYPSEIRAPSGTLAGVSGFQVNFSNQDVLTPGDEPQALVAMNPAALKACLPELESGGTIIVNTDAFTRNNLKKADYESNPLEDDSLSGFHVLEVPLTSLNREALKDIEALSLKEKDRSQNFCALGLVFWLFDRPMEPTLAWIKKKFAKKPAVIQANMTALETGFHFGETMRTFQHRYRIRPASLAPGTYRKITGNEATAIGFVTAAQKMGKSLFYGTYPITPATDILHALARLQHFDVRTFQAEDEIAAMGSIIGAAFGGALAVTGTSGPGVALKSEAMNLAIALELPMVIVNVQRGGPSTGLPTKTEQSDLLQAMFGRNGESPIAIVAPRSPSDAFDVAIEASRMAVRAMTPVMIMSDGFLGNSSEPWLIPNPDDIPEIEFEHPVAPSNGDGPFLPYKRDEDTLGRPWAIPGTPGLEHRIGGLSKAPITGNVSHEAQHHEQMVAERAEKIARLADMIPPLEVYGPESGKLLILSWGSTYGAVRSGVRRAQEKGHDVAHVHLRHLNPFPNNLQEILSSYKRVVVPEMNGGQLTYMLRSKFIMDIQAYPKVHARPFKISEVLDMIEGILGE
ncbi:MAG: 2-oxoacid:acceptor oxidoreductase subunit alpha [Chloroflexi bacterium]|nr:MAG: 2-oxoacid:acceptor oxidoreductase subunit alpha [Chloroflexota bacterium]